MTGTNPAAHASAARAGGFSSSAERIEGSLSSADRAAGPSSSADRAAGPSSSADRAAGPRSSADRAGGSSSWTRGADGPSLTERRKAATRMEIARAAAGLFMRDGLRATRTEDIARAAGVAPRTFYRYFAGKEECLGPLFAAGVQKWAEAVRDAPAELTVPEALHHAVVQTLTPGVGVRLESMEWVRSLLRLAEGSPALFRVWGQECQAAERTLATVLAARISTPADDVAPASEIRLSAAVASAALRVAVEAWAAGDDPADSPAGPVALAVRHLQALGDFPWGAV
ncbi:TetR family transcriptional regulator [Streptomyces sp. NPDC048275]|uniref:TetR/AcrR family transcriptional regulator n=1 Tax=Streptomyces sp. NPDC048275 TaxID=3155629 RepID=UPI0033E010D5